MLNRPVPQDAATLDALLSEPSESLISLMKRLEGDIMILGIAGKMGVTMGLRAVHAIRSAGVKKRVLGVARFSNPGSREELERGGIETIACDLLEREQVSRLPQTANIIFMAGRKFGTDGSEDLTWAMNTLVPMHVAEHFRNSRIVAFSTGCVYPLVSPLSGGCDETVPPSPIGEYSQSCLGRERIFQYACRRFGTPLLLYRLNYAVDLRYGVLHDIARQIWEGVPVNDTVSHFNVIWQGDANDIALRCLEFCSNPPAYMNVTGPETASVHYIAGELGRLMGKEVTFTESSGELCYLNNSARMAGEFGYPGVSLQQMIEWQAGWIMNGGCSLGKPTHFEVNTGKF